MPDTKYGKSALVEDLISRTSGVTRGQIEQVVGAVWDTIRDRVADGTAVTVTGFGTFRPAERAARMGTNLQTKERIQIPASRGVRFTPGAELKNAMNNRGRASGSYAAERARSGLGTRRDVSAGKSAATSGRQQRGRAAPAAGSTGGKQRQRGGSSS